MMDDIDTFFKRLDAVKDKFNWTLKPPFFPAVTDSQRPRPIRAGLKVPDGKQTINEHPETYYCPITAVVLAETGQRRHVSCVKDHDIRAAVNLPEHECDLLVSAADGFANDNGVRERLLQTLGLTETT